ncbi:response regulator [Candidatus Woesearchaeota archaeon]|nr:response regulator [Candidatus Woesearchaeota archaeon]
MDYDVLVVSAYQSIREGIKQDVLEKLGGFDPSKVYATMSGKEAIKTIDDVVAGGGRVGVAIVDLKALEVDGLGVLEHLASNYPSIPIIMTSGGDAISDAPTFVGKGAYAYFPKGGRVESLLGLVRSALDKQTKA